MPSWAIGLVCFGLGLLIGSIAARRMERRQVERLASAERRARQAERLAEIGSMTGGLAHEIKNPLSTIGLNAQLLAEGIEELPEGSELKPRLLNRVKPLRRETDRLRGILTDFLEFAGNVRPDKRPGDLNAIVTELADFYMPEAQRQSVRIRLELCDGQLSCAFDQRLLKQALLNLMLNATQAMHNAGVAGELIMRTARATDADLGEVVTVHVIDTGPGIAPDVLEKIFTPYFTTKSGGTGLGLPTARRYIEEHGGRLDVNTKPGVGSDFCVVLPAMTSADAPK
jgi:signal transduction histidine kinase